MAGGVCGGWSQNLLGRNGVGKKRARQGYRNRAVDAGAVKAEPLRTEEKHTSTLLLPATREGSEAAATEGRTGGGGGEKRLPLARAHTHSHSLSSLPLGRIPTGGSRSSRVLHTHLHFLNEPLDGWQ